MSDVLCKDTESTGTPDMVLMFRELDRSLVTRTPGAVSEGRYWSLLPDCYKGTTPWFGVGIQKGRSCLRDCETLQELLLRDPVIQFELKLWNLETIV